ncbi:MAG: hypothetical protein PVJ02_11830 [Gemmatimonadota bacterium]|jgi:hypothetical protein
MTRKSLFLIAPLALLMGCRSDAATPVAPEVTTAQLSLSETAQENRHHGALGTVYVSSQGLYYDTFVSAEVLPMKGRFQKLENGVTEFGPGDPGYLGGRWWIDDGNGIQDANDTFLLCPLLPPGRANP